MYFVSGKEKKEGSSPLSLDPAEQKRIEDVAEAWAAPFLAAASWPSARLRTKGAES
jgi:hypothetical protein